MIVWKPANTALEAKSLTKTTGKGTTRRAINLLPSPVTAEHEVLQTGCGITSCWSPWKARAALVS